MMKSFIAVFTLFCHVAFPVKHSLKFMFTGSSGVPKFPDFLGVVNVDETEMVYWAGNIQNLPQPKQDWLKIFKEKHSELKYLHSHCIDEQTFFRKNIKDRMKHRSQTGGVHTFQRLYGCEWDNETEENNTFDHFGYDGEDFVAVSQKMGTWTNVNQRNLDNEKKHIQSFLTTVCLDKLKKYLDYGRSFLQRTDLPSVSLLQKTPSSSVSCLATGFYPDRANLSWRRDGVELLEDKNLRLILPNHDGTFQWNVVLNLSVKPEDWMRFDCVFQLSGVKNSIIVKLDKTAIKTNRDYYICKTPDETNTHIIVAALVFTIFLIVILIFIVYKTLTDSDDYQTLPPSNHLKYLSIAALIVALILIVLHGILFYINNEDLHINLPSDNVSKWSEPLAGNQWRI
ncbi:zinc-alpha-2-glycoprotein-like [Stegastes partitus]|uniref:Zinc-alpha-2-glycoprotein-like n=1 Tax=Stegastes partitus TaxID=144197 RepID=A0A3B5AHD0_9TELE|nr:PREDICTED: zinc-alpha-2-glycoprotein-like [Stegastes partitus]